MNVFIKTFGCQQNIADSERMVSYYRACGYAYTDSENKADLLVINSCMVREKAEERVYGLIRNIRKGITGFRSDIRIVLTGCIVGAAAREPSGKLKKKLSKRLPDVELLAPDEVGFEYDPHRALGATHQKHGWVVISNGCNNYCAFCIVPFSRGKEVSRSYKDILDEVQGMVSDGYSSITLLGQNVNSYGADLVRSSSGEYRLPDGRAVTPVMVKHLNRYRIPTLFPFLLEDIARISGINTVTFTSSNPWDFSDDLIEVIFRNKNIDRLLHLPVQSGSTSILRSMNRWYSRDEYLALLDRIRKRVQDVEFMTDIIVGFPGETEEDFQQTVELARRADFKKAFIACYSPRPGTSATQKLADTISWEEKKRRFRILNELINVPNLGISQSSDWIRRGV